MKTCYHWDVSETGQCLKCATLVTVEEAITVSVGLGTAERPPLSGDIVVNGYRPSVRDAIGLATIAVRWSSWMASAWWGSLWNVMS